MISIGDQYSILILLICDFAWDPFVDLGHRVGASISGDQHFLYSAHEIKFVGIT